MRWRALLRKVFQLMEMVYQAVRHRRAYQELVYRMPMAVHTLTREFVMEDDLRTAATAPHCRQPSIASYPTVPHRCEHPHYSAYLHGNQNGKFRECRECGARWAATMWRVPGTQQQVPIYDKPLPARPQPGAKVPRATRPTRSSTGCSSSSTPSGRPSARLGSATASAPASATLGARPKPQPTLPSRQRRSQAAHPEHFFLGEPDAVDDWRQEPQGVTSRQSEGVPEEADHQGDTDMEEESAYQEYDWENFQNDWAATESHQQEERLR